MTDGDAPRWAAGETALLITVPEAEPLVGEARKRYDPAAGAGVPAHVTVLYPFLREERIGPEVRAELRELFARHRPFALRFAGFGRFPGLLWLAPEPEEPLQALTAVAEVQLVACDSVRWHHRESFPLGGGSPDER